MQPRVLAFFALSAALAAAPASGQSGLRPPERAEPGLDPAFARGWLASDFGVFRYPAYHWKDAARLTPAPRMSWSYSITERSSFGMAFTQASELDYEPQPFSLFGRFRLSPDWSFSAEAVPRDRDGMLKLQDMRLQDVRIGVQHRF